LSKLAVGGYTIDILRLSHCTRLERSLGSRIVTYADDLVILCRIGVLMSNDENDPLPKAQVSAFTQALADLGWTDGRNVRVELRWGGGDDTSRVRALAHELVGLPLIVTRVSRRLLPSSGRRGRSQSSL
jgi:hypothetical protein